MKRILLAGVAGMSALGAAHGQGLYYSGNDPKESIPLKWIVGVDLTYDDNVNPTAFNPITGAKIKDDSTSINPYAGVSFVRATPQTTWDVYARLGLIYYFDQPTAQGSDDVSTQARLGVNLTHAFNERLRFSSRNFVAYEREPNYAYGTASSAQVGEYFFWQTDNSIGYRWSERLATYTGLTLEGMDYDSTVPNADRFIWTLYHQFRYQVSQQSVATLDYRYGQSTGNGVASDASDQFLLLGFEHRFNPTTILIAKAGAQFHDVDGAAGSDTTSPYVELALNSQINTAFSVRAFARYGIENYDTVRSVFGPVGGVTDLYEFTSRQTLRVGINGTYTVSQRFSVFGGVDYIPSSFDDGRLRNVYPGPAAVDGLDEDLVNAYIGVSVKITDMISGDISYNYTDSSSDLFGNSYTRNRVSVGLRATF